MARYRKLLVYGYERKHLVYGYERKRLVHVLFSDIIIICVLSDIIIMCVSKACISHLSPDDIIIIRTARPTHRAYTNDMFHTFNFITLENTKISGLFPKKLWHLMVQIYWNDTVVICHGTNILKWYSCDTSWYKYTEMIQLWHLMVNKLSKIEKSELWQSRYCELCRKSCRLMC